MSTEMSTEIIPAETPIGPINKPISIKFDKLPVLNGYENYQRWVGCWEITFDSMGLLKYLTGELPKPTDENSLEMINWKNADKQLRGLILNAVDESLESVVMSHQTAKEAWDHFQSRFDRETSNSTISLLKAITNISYQEDESTDELLVRFNDAWNHLRNRSLSAETPLTKVFRDITSSDDLKGAFLLNSLPKSLETVVDNLVNKEIISYNDVSEKLIEVSARKKMKNTDIGAFSAIKSFDKECSFCKAKKQKFHGHLFTECKKLQAPIGKEF